MMMPTVLEVPPNTPSLGGTVGANSSLVLGLQEKWAKGRCVTDLRFSPHRQVDVPAW